MWVFIDKLTNVEGRYLANVVIGTLNADRPGKTFLQTTKVLEQA